MYRRYTIDKKYLRHHDCLPITVSLSNGKSLPSVPVIINQVNKITNRVIIPLELSFWCFIQNSFLLLSFLFSSLTQDRIPIQRLISPRLVNLVYVKKDNMIYVGIHILQRINVRCRHIMWWGISIYWPWNYMILLHFE